MSASTTAVLNYDDDNMEIVEVIYDVANGQAAADAAPYVLDEETGENDTKDLQHDTAHLKGTTPFTHEFIYKSGYQIPRGTTFKGDIPIYVEGQIEDPQTTDLDFTWGDIYKGSKAVDKPVPIAVDPYKKYKVTGTYTQGYLTVPYIIKLQSTTSSKTAESRGIAKTHTNWDFVIHWYDLGGVDAVVDHLDYEVGKGKTVPDKRRFAVDSETADNETDTLQNDTVTFNVDVGSSHSFGTSSGFPIAYGTTFEGYVPDNDNGKIETKTKETFTWGRTWRGDKTWTESVAVPVKAHSTAEVDGSIQRGNLLVPYTIHLRVKKTGEPVTTTGTSTTYTAWDFESQVKG